jgi:hypothetical protein
MKKYALCGLFTLLIFIIGTAFRADNVAGTGGGDERTRKTAFSNQNVPQTIARKLKRDAARLALRIESDKEDLKYINVRIPQDRLNGIYNLLVNIYLSSEVGKSIEKCNVHTYPNPSIDHLVIIFDKNVSWAAPLRNGITETDNKNFNKLLNAYDLSIEKYVNWNDTQDAVTIRSKDALNMAALANEFENVEGIAEIDLGLPKVAGNDIRMKRMTNGWEIDYVLRFGAYASTGGKEHIWKYRADDLGNVTFVSEGGEPIPAWMKCETIELANNRF